MLIIIVVCCMLLMQVCILYYGFQSTPLEDSSPAFFCKVLCVFSWRRMLLREKSACLMTKSHISPHRPTFLQVLELPEIYLRSSQQVCQSLWPLCNPVLIGQDHLKTFLVLYTPLWPYFSLGKLGWGHALQHRCHLQCPASVPPWLSLALSQG